MAIHSIRFHAKLSMLRSGPYESFNNKIKKDPEYGSMNAINVHKTTLTHPLLTRLAAGLGKDGSLHTDHDSPQKVVPPLSDA